MDQKHTADSTGANQEANGLMPTPRAVRRSFPSPDGNYLHMGEAGQGKGQKASWSLFPILSKCSALDVRTHFGRLCYSRRYLSLIFFLFNRHVSIGLLCHLMETRISSISHST